ncbi:MAG: ATP-dependent helicase C-terminal domain-containing protein, partial [Bryobacteraceae bacterium]
VLDEFHERHLDGDVALALLRRLQLTLRPDLRLIVMSATLDAAPIAAYLDNCPVLRSEGRLFDVAIQYAGHSPKPLEEQVAAAVEKVADDGLDGDVLVFLPGAAEIRRAARACEPAAQRKRLLITPLYGDLSPQEQDRAVQPAAQRKLILSTNVAESSITIDGVTYVIDSGLARVASDSRWTGLPTLEVRRISKASAKQRAGRAGRTRPGRVIRLYSLEDYNRRAEAEAPEIQRRELSQVMLDLQSLGVEDPPWFEAPPAEAVIQARDLLDQLRASEDADELARYPLHPRLARLVTSAAGSGAAREGCVLAAFLSSGERHSVPDAIALLDQDRSRNVEQINRQLHRLTRQSGAKQHTLAQEDEPLRIALLRAFPDRVARRRTGGDAQLCSGKVAALPEHWKSEFLVAVEIEDRKDQSSPLIRVASSIKPEWLLDLYPERITEKSDVVWNRGAERAEAVSALLYDALVIEESRHGNPDSEQASRLLAEMALEAGVHRFVSPGDLESFLARAEFASRHSAFPKLDDKDVEETLRDLCHGRKSYAELKAAASDGGLIRALRQRLPPEAGRLLEETAPDRLPLRGRMVKVNYVRNQAPWIASRLQDFFGVRETPRIAGGRVPVVVHLLAPNRRPVQMTTDLTGFWDRLYPQVRRELSRRYPRHAWPENPA